MTQQNRTEQQHRPEWIQKAALAVAAFYGTERAKEHRQASEANLKTEAHTAHDKIADIIHRHYQEK